jgi:RNase P subunit RPR2
MSDEDRVYLCTACHWEKVPYKRWQMGIKTKDAYFTCLPCGEEQARAVKHTVAPISNKAAYTLITDYTLLKQINPKRT